YEEQQNKGLDLENINLNLEPNLAAALSYLLLIVSGIGFLIIERKSDFVRFHALQSVLFTAAWLLVYVAWTVLWLIFSLFSAMAGFPNPPPLIGKIPNLLFPGLFLLLLLLFARRSKAEPR